MYRRRRSPLSGILPILVFGVIIALIYLVYDSLRAPGSPSPTDRPSPEPTPSTVRAPELTITPRALLTVPPVSVGIISDASLFIPTAGIYATIIPVYLDGESWDVSQLGMNIGHLQGTSWIDDRQPGNIVLSGHVEMSDGRAGIFSNLKTLKSGDPLILSYGSNQRRYVVTEVKIVAPDDLTPLYPTTNDQLTLITCGNYNFLQDTYLERVVVVAERVS